MGVRAGVGEGEVCLSGYEVPRGRGGMRRAGRKAGAMVGDSGEVCGERMMFWPRDAFC